MPDSSSSDTLSETFFNHDAPDASSPRHDTDRSRSPRLPERFTHSQPEPFDPNSQGPEHVTTKVVFAVLTPGFALESVEVGLPLPVGLEHAIEATQQTRQGSTADMFPSLIPACRQPDPCWGVLVAVSVRQWWKNIVCFYVCLEQPRLFAHPCPASVDRITLLEAAGLESETHASVFCDEYGPLADHETCEVSTGSTITILPAHTMLPWTMSLREMLQTHLPWHTAPAFPLEYEDDVLLLACEHGQEIFRIQPQREVHYRQDIAECARCSQHLLRIASASPRPLDVSWQGRHCRTVVAAISAGRFNAQDQPCVCLLDARNILKGWIPIITQDGWIDVWALLSELHHEVDRYCELSIQEQDGPWRWHHTSPGSILTVICCQRAGPDAATEPTALTAQTSSIPSTPSRAEPYGGRPDARRDADVGRQSPTTQHGSSMSRAVQGVIGCALFGAGEACTDPVDHDMWDAPSPDRAIHDGKGYTTPVLMCCAVSLLLVCFLLWKSRKARAGRHTTAMFRLVSLLSLIHLSDAMQLPPQPSLHSCAALALPPTAVCNTARPLPTPCRGHMPHQLCAPATSCAVSDEVLRFTDSVTLITLLEHSVQQDPSPLFLAATLVETLLEHFATELPCNADERLPGQHQTLRLQSALGPEYFDLTANTMQLPHSVDDIAILSRVWEPTWLAPDLSTLALPTHTLAYVRCWTPWPTFMSNMPRDARPILHFYTDGSWTESQQIGGYAVLLVLEWQTAFTLYGVLGEPTHGCMGRPWQLDGPPALRNEEIAVCAALLWLAQSKSLCAFERVLLHFDCFGAGLTAAGDWNPSSEFAGRIRDIQRWIDAFLGTPTHYEHVKAHNGHPLNDAADVLAKLASQNRVSLGHPPTACVRIACQADLSWLAAAFRHDASSVFPFKGPSTMHWSSAPPQSQLSLRPEDLVPTKSVLTDSSRHEAKHFEVCAVTLNVQGFGGQQKYIEDQLEHCQCNIVFIQETKSPSGQCHTKSFLRLSTDAKKHWGTAIWVSKVRGVLQCNGKACHISESDVRIVVETERLLLITISVGDLQVVAFSAHCPHTGHQAEADRFLEQLRLRLRPYRSSTLIIGGIDLNGRPRLHEEGTTGDLECGETDATGITATQVLADLALWLPSTFSRYHVGSSFTYRHPTGTEHRIDFIAIGGVCTTHELYSQVILDFDTGSAGEDHSPVLCHLRGTLGTCTGGRRLKRTKYDVDAMLSPEGKQTIASAMANYASPVWTVHPDEHCQHLTTYLQQIMEKHFKLPDSRPRASYIPDKVWRIRDAKIALKRMTRHRHNLWPALTVRAFQQWRTNECHAVEQLVQRQSFLYQLTSSAIKFATLYVKREIRRAKTEYLQRLIYQHGDQAGCILSKAKQAGVGGQKAKSPFRPLPVLMKQDGEIACNRADRDQVWLRHFGDQEYGQILPTAEFVCLRPENLIIDDELQWDPAHLPSQGEIEAVLRQMPRRKAAGLDMVPGELLRAAPGHMAAALQPLMTKSAAILQQPVQWRGGLLFEAWKRSASQRDVTAYRSLYVASTVGKAYHKVMRLRSRALLNIPYTISILVHASKHR